VTSLPQEKLRRDWVEKFKNYLMVEKNGSRLTGENYARDIADFEKFMAGKAGEGFSWDQVQVIHIRSYLAWLNHENYARRTIARRISSLRSFYKFLLREEYIGQNPLSEYLLKLSTMDSRRSDWTPSAIAASC
jgi:integrase/recombinase XerC